MKTKVLTPKEIVKELDKFIISQNEAKKSVAISLKNRDRRKRIEDIEMRKEITPKNVILIGPTGVGKTEIARRISKIINAPFIKVDATKYTEVGYVGKDVESIIRDLVEITYRKMRDELYKSMEEASRNNVLKEMVKYIEPDKKLTAEERNTIIKDISSGKYDDLKIQLDRKNKPLPNPIIEIVGNTGEDSIGGLGSFFEQVVNGVPINSNGKVKMTVKDAIKRLTEEETEKAIDTEDLKDKVVDNIENNGIVFIDEIDKIAERNGIERGDVSRQGVQRDILPIIEGTTVMTSFGPVHTDHILFIAAGAFTKSSPSDLMPELQGRFPIRVRLKSLEKEDFIKILTEVEYNIIDQYVAMLATDNVFVNFTKSAIDKISEISVRLNENVENIGARRLASVVEELLKDLLYEAPYDKPKKISIDPNYIKKIYKKEYEKENLDKFIL